MVEIKIRKQGALLDGHGPDILQRRSRSALHEAVALLEREVKEETPVGVYGAKGGLLATIHGEVETGISKMRGFVSHGSPHGDVIEQGRRPGGKMPPQGTLLRWVEKKMGVTGKAAAGLEYVIRRKIGKKGFPGARMFEKGLQRGRARVIAIFQKAGHDISVELDQ